MSTLVDGERITAPQVCARARISYRQLDHWISRGYVAVAHPQPGSGTARIFSPEEMDFIVRLAQLVAAGIPVARAAKLVPELGIDGYAQLGEGVKILVEPVAHNG